MTKVKNILRAFYKKNFILLKWFFVILVILGIVIVPVLSALLSL